ncbi:non-specific serine/threonine protein kinase [Trifolium repens]|nr:non-specific serine/threonine protein kinase [Trifolium repens]
MEKEKLVKFTDQQLRIATDNYSYRLGSGGFGIVYKGCFSNGTMIAVKVLHGRSTEKNDKQFMAEVGTIGKVHHFNLARLYGFCFEKNIIGLVYEYMENGSLDKENTHITMTGGRGTPGYAAPELWMPFPVTYKCDVYSFGILLFEIIGRRRNHDASISESREWFPMLVWKKFDAEEVEDLLVACGIEEKNMEIVERMVKYQLELASA